MLISFAGLQTLEARLREFNDRPLRIGAFSAGSNITGLLADVDAATALLHRWGALACWDYAAAAPYVDMDMNPVVAGAINLLLRAACARALSA